MAISLIRSAESHTGTTGSVSETSFTFALGQAGDSPKGVAVFVMQGVLDTSEVSSVTYGGSTLTPYYEAKDTSTEKGQCCAYFLGASVPSGAQNVVVNRTSSTTVMYAVGFILGGSRDTRVITGYTYGENNAISAQTVNDGFSSGQTSICLGAAYSGDNTPAPAASTGFTSAGTMEGTYAYSFGAGYETTPTYGSRSRGLAATSDDRAYILMLVTDEALPVFAGGAPFIGGGWY